MARSPLPPEQRDRVSRTPALPARAISELAIPAFDILGPDARPARIFTVLALDDPDYPVAILDPAGHLIEPLSLGLSDMTRALAPRTGHDYLIALRACLDRWAAPAPALADLFGDVTSARRAIRAMLRANGCTFSRSRRHDGSIDVRVPVCTAGPAPCEAAADTGGAGHDACADDACGNLRSGSGGQRITLALLALKHCYDALYLRERWHGANPLEIDDAASRRRTPAPAGATRGGRWAAIEACNLFHVVARGDQLRDLDSTFYTGRVLAAARDWPAGVGAATRLTAACGCRIGETLALTLADWAVHDFGVLIAAPNKGSRARRTKLLYLSDAARADLVAYVDGPRAQATGLTLVAARRQWTRRKRAGLAPFWADAPLFLSPRHKRLTPGHFREYYWRPAMRRLGCPHVVPHRLRHEYVFRRRLQIHEEARSPEEESAMIEEFARIQGWSSGESMVHYYSRQFDMLLAQTLLTRLDAHAVALPAQALPGPAFARQEDALMARLHRATAPTHTPQGETP